MKKTLQKTILLAILSVISSASKAQNWKQTNAPKTIVWSVALSGTNLFAALPSGVHFSSDMGQKWEKRLSGSAYSLVSNGTDIFAGTHAGLFKSSDLGITWLNVTPKGLTSSDTSIYALLIKGTDIFVGTGDNGIFKSTLSGISKESWISFTKNLDNTYSIKSLAVCGTNILAGTTGHGVWISPLADANWVATTGMGTSADYIHSLAVAGSTVFAGNISGTPVFYQSTNGGSTWEPASTGSGKTVQGIATNGNNVYVGNEKEGVFLSKNKGDSWETYSEGFKDGTGKWICDNMTGYSYAFLGKKIIVGTQCGVWISEDGVAVGVKNLNRNNDILVYPNPANGRFSVKSEIENSRIELVNLLGEKVYSGRLRIGETEIYLNTYPKGIYFYQIKNDNEILKTGKIISE